MRAKMLECFAWEPYFYAAGRKGCLNCGPFCSAGGGGVQQHRTGHGHNRLLNQIMCAPIWGLQFRFRALCDTFGVLRSYTLYSHASKSPVSNIRATDSIICLESKLKYYLFTKTYSASICSFRICAFISVNIKRIPVDQLLFALYKNPQ